MAESSSYYEEIVPNPQPYVTNTTTKTVHRHHEKHHDDHHHHDKHHHRGDSSAIGWATWLCLFFVGAILLTFFIVAIVASAQSNHVKHHVDSRFAEWQTTMDEQQEQQDILPTNMVTISALSTKGTVQRRVMLCARQSYYSKKGDGVLLEENKLHSLKESIEELTQRDMRDFTYYHVKGRIRLSLSKAVVAEGQQPHHKSYLTVDYNVTSSFGRISSIRLEELEFNTVDQSLGAMRSIVLCTNNPFMDVQRCDASLTKRNILALHGTETIPLVIALPPSLKKGTLTSVPTGDLHQEQVVDLADEQEEEEEEDEETNENGLSPDKVHKGKLRREVIGQRMYNIVFYQTTETGGSSSPPQNKTRLHGKDSLKTASSYKEQRILTLEPVQC